MQKTFCKILFRTFFHLIIKCSNQLFEIDNDKVIVLISVRISTAYRVKFRDRNQNPDPTKSVTILCSMFELGITVAIRIERDNNRNECSNKWQHQSEEQKDVLNAVCFYFISIIIIINKG